MLIANMLLVSGQLVEQTNCSVINRMLSVMFFTEPEKMLNGVPRTPSALPVKLFGYIALLSAEEFPAKLLPLFLLQRIVHPSPKKWTLSATWVFLFVYEFIINVRIVWFVLVWCFKCVFLCIKRNRSPVAGIKHSAKSCCQPPPHFWTLFPVYVTGYHFQMFLFWSRLGF